MEGIHTHIGVCQSPAYEGVVGMQRANTADTTRLRVQAATGENRDVFKRSG